MEKAVVLTDTLKDLTTVDLVALQEAVVSTVSGIGNYCFLFYFFFSKEVLDS